MNEYRERPSHTAPSRAVRCAASVTVGSRVASNSDDIGKPSRSQGQKGKAARVTLLDIGS